MTEIAGGGPSAAITLWSLDPHEPYRRPPLSEALHDAYRTMKREDPSGAATFR